MATKRTTSSNNAALQRQIAELQVQLAAAQQARAGAGSGVSTAANSGNINTGAQTINNTQGGSVVDGSVQVHGGHFIGRDFVQTVTQGTQAGDDPEEVKSVIALYLHALTIDLAGLKLGEIDGSADQTRQTPLQLADVYVPLDTTHRIGKGDTLAQWLLRRARRSHGFEVVPENSLGPVSVLEALAAHRELTLLGKPGSGKSTFGASVLLALAQGWQGHGEALGQLGEHWTHGALLPIRVVLRRFAEQLPAGTAPARAGDLWAFIGRDLDASGYGLSADAMKYVQRIARTHGALVLLDGLDECGNAEQRARVLAAVREFISSAGAACRFLLTARPYAWPAGPDPLHGVYAVADLQSAQIEQFVRAWYAALVKRHWRSPGEAQTKTDDLLRAQHRPDLRPLAQNPLLLTLMAALHTNRGGLPQDRADLYNESVDLLMLRWNRQIGADKALLDELAIPGLKLSDLREVLEDLAFRIHEHSVGADGPADIGEDRLVRAFRPVLGGSKDKADVVVDYIEKRAGLLHGQGEKDGERQFSFPHRTFQEFLAACHLSAREDFPAECARLARAAAGHWQVVLPLAARLAKAERGASAADELLGGRSIAEFRALRQPVAADWVCAWLAGLQLQEIGAGGISKSDRTLAIAARVKGWLVACLPMHPEQGGAPAVVRAQAGDVLAALGDPRFDPERFHLPTDSALGFVPIAADPSFVFGTRKADAERVAKTIGRDVGKDEINGKATPTPHFHIARYPVTVAQFRAFVEATRLELGDPAALRDPDSRPVRYVSWHEATAYCAWLTGMLAASPRFAERGVDSLVREQGWTVSLPSELEWEKAARGGQAPTVWPWGDTPDPQRANDNDSGVGDTSAVGCFPANGFGLHDMIGNVWVWTHSRFGDYPYPMNDPRRENPRPVKDSLLVARGGSWRDSGAGPRCAFRDWAHPDNRVNYLGFRVVLRAAPDSKR